MSVLDLSSKGTFTGAVQTSGGLGPVQSSIKDGPISVTLHERGLVASLHPNSPDIMINTQSGVVSAAVEKIALQSTGSPSEFGQFQRSTNQVFMQGQEFRGRGLAVHVTQDDVLIRFGKGLESCVLVKALDAETRGIALYNNDILSAGDIKAPIAGAAPVVARRDFDNVLTSAPL